MKFASMFTGEALTLKIHKKYIKFIWIPAYMGVVLNEIADASGKESIQKGEDSQYFIHVTYLKTYWKSKLRVMVQRIGKKERKYF
jgi:hypothetical protein